MVVIRDLLMISRKEDYMFRLLKIAVAGVLGLMIGLTLLTSNAFAQSVTPGTTVTVAQVTTIAQGIQPGHKTGTAPQAPLGLFRSKGPSVTNHRCVQVRAYRWYKSHGRWHKQWYWTCKRR